MADQTLEAAQILARRRIGELTTNQLPTSPLSLDNLFLNLLSGDESAAIAIINDIAVREFGLIINNDKLIDLPPTINLQPRETLKVLYQAPRLVWGIPPLPKDRPYRKRGRRDQGQE